MEESGPGRAFLEALRSRDFATIETCFDPMVRFRALIPSGVGEASDPAAAVAYLQRWFGSADHFEMVHGDIEPVADRLHICYHVRLHDEDGWQEVEQQAYCEVIGDRIARFDLLCSGFRPAGAPPIP